MLFRPSPSSARLSFLQSLKILYPIYRRLRAALRSASCRCSHRSKARDSMLLTLEGSVSYLIPVSAKHKSQSSSKYALSLADCSLFLHTNTHLQAFVAVSGNVHVFAEPPLMILVASLLIWVSPTTMTGGPPRRVQSPFLGTEISGALVVLYKKLFTSCSASSASAIAILALMVLKLQIIFMPSAQVYSAWARSQCALFSCSSLIWCEVNKIIFTDSILRVCAPRLCRARLAKNCSVLSNES